MQEAEFELNSESPRRAVPFRGSHFSAVPAAGRLQTKPAPPAWVDRAFAGVGRWLGFGSGEDEQPRGVTPRSHPREEGARRIVGGCGGYAGGDRVWGVSSRLKWRRLAGRASGFHGAGGAVVARTAGCGYSPGASVQGNAETRLSHPGSCASWKGRPVRFFTLYLPGQRRRVCLFVKVN